MANNNTGVENTGNRNSGNRNSGNRNSGDENSGDCNSGSCNSGKWNSGHWNTGDWNSGNRNSGYFNTGSPDKIQIFNVWVEMTQEEFEEKYNIYANLPLNRWVDSSEMSDTEKKINSGWEARGGFLKTLEFKEACVVWWAENEDRHKDFLKLPSFDAEIFKEITGIDVTQETEEMTMEEVCEALGKTIKIKK